MAPPATHFVADPFAPTRGLAAPAVPAAGAAPRQFVAESGLPGAGLPGDRLAHLAARRAFVGLKLAFLDVLDQVQGPQAVWLRQQVRGAEEPLDLWLLRASVFELIAAPGFKPLRHQLRRALDSLFPESQPPSAFSPF
jgi:hypothetical protein